MVGIELKIMIIAPYIISIAETLRYETIALSLQRVASQQEYRGTTLPPVGVIKTDKFFFPQQQPLETGEGERRQN